MLASILAFLVSMPAKVWAYAILTLVLVCLFFGTVFYIRSVNRQLETEQREKQRLERKSEGLQILVNTANIAQEVQNERIIANQKRTNSNVSNRNHSISRNTDSNQRSNSFDDAKQDYCREYPDDSICVGLRN